nr:CinA family nicotinamide mononucleotide deamidase-related protein [Ardenticatena sp.]
MNAEIITIGTELLLGQIVDTNAAWLAQRLASLGVNLYYKTTVGDNRERIANAIRLALSRADVVLTTGGLGPTVDDMTRDAIADATGRRLVRDPELVAHITALFRRWGREPSANNLRQADLPEGARILPNPIGTASGFLVEHEGRYVIAMPGVPREMKRMMDEQVAPFLRRLVGEQVVIKIRVLHTVGVGESVIDEQIADLEQGANPTVGLAAHSGQVDVRITARAPNEKQADVMIAQVERQIRNRLGDAIYGADEETLEGVVAQALARLGRGVVVESNTRGEIAARLREAAPNLLVAAVCVEPDVVACETAQAMAQEVRQAHDVAWGLVVLGTSGANEGVYGETRGETVVALATAEQVYCKALGLGGADEHSLSWVRNRALDFVRRVLRNLSP